jgi:DNA-3-methyladenine glycosylase I
MFTVVVRRKLKSSCAVRVLSHCAGPTMSNNNNNHNKRRQSVTTNTTSTTTTTTATEKVKNTQSKRPRKGTSGTTTALVELISADSNVNNHDHLNDNGLGGCHRCAWSEKLSNPRYVAYHDREWGKPCHDELRLFEMLNLEGAQAGLSWETVLNKREHYRVAFDGWDADAISRFDDERVAELMCNAGIVRNRLKIKATIANAVAYRQLCAEYGGLDEYLWSQVPERQPVLASDNERRVTTALSDKISADLKRRGFKFVGSTIVYAYLQAVGVVNDHDLDCAFRFK